MKPRPTPLDVPTSPRFWTVDLPGKGAHLLRVPLLPHCATLHGLIREMEAKLAAVMATREAEADGEAGELPGEVRRYMLGYWSQYIAATVGAAWWHRAFELETPIKQKGAMPDWMAFGAGVLDELQDRDYSLDDIWALYESVAPRICTAIGVVDDATVRRDFFVPARAGLSG